MGTRYHVIGSGTDESQKQQQEAAAVENNGKDAATKEAEDGPLARGEGAGEPAEWGEAYDGGIDWNERDYNYYDPQSGCRDPSDESHGYFEEMQSDVEASEDWDQDDEE